MRITENLNLSSFNSYRINASCKKAYFPENESDLLAILGDPNLDKPVILGNGNNIILSRQFYNQDFIILNGCFENTEINKNIIVAEAGATMLHLSELALANSLTGFEIFYDIPSSVGGAVVMNAGAGGEEIKDYIEKVRYLDLDDMKVKEVQVDDIHYSYRNSIFQQQGSAVILKTWFRLQKGNQEMIHSKMQETKKMRWEKQPRDYPNCGSVFKRPPGYFVGQIMEELGLKGRSIGDARISEKHGGFIINTGNATGEDILKLIDIVKEKVYVRYGIDLEIEQRII